jgi:hypothetical protein
MNIRSIMAGMILAVGVLSAPMQSQQAVQSGPGGSASIEGIVVRLGTNEPLAEVDVELSRVEGTTNAPVTPAAVEFFRTVLSGGGPFGDAPPAVIASEVQYVKTGSNGRFTFRNLKAGTYRLVAARVATRPGGAYYPAEYGQHDPRGRGLNFPIREGQEIRDLRMEMPTTSAITGVVLDEDRVPMGNVSVLALVVQYKDGRRILNLEQATHTNERGEYRLFWLGPGQYYAAAVVEDPNRRTMRPDISPPGRRGPTDRATSPAVLRRVLPSGETIEETYAMLYNGGALNLEQARPIEVRPGANVPGVDFPMGVARLPVRRIRGTVIDGSNQRPAAGALVRAIPLRWSPNPQVLNSMAGPDGKFELSGALPGRYALFAMVTPPGARTVPIVAPVGQVPMGSLADALAFSPTPTATQVGYLPIEMSSADLEGLTVTTAGGIGLQGRVLVEGRGVSAETDFTRIRLGLVRNPDLISMPGGMAPAPLPAVGTPPAPRIINGQAGADGKFTLYAFPGQYRISVTGVPPEVYIKTIRAGSVDVLSAGIDTFTAVDSPIEVVLGTDGTEITGTVLSEDGRAVGANVVVALVPDSPALRQRLDLFRNTTTNAAGKFRLENVPPGGYKLFSWRYVEQSAWMDSSFLSPYETLGAAVTVRPGAKQEVDLRALPRR